MKKNVFSAAIVSFGILIFSTGANASNIKEGQWSMTTVIRMDGMGDQSAEAMKEMEKMSPEEKAMMQKMMGGMKIGGAPGGGISTTMTQCLTNDNPVPKASDREDCQQTHKIKGDTVNFEVTCNNSHSTGQVTYKKDTMKGTITSSQTDNGKVSNATIDISGQYVGPCNQDSENTVSNMDTPSAGLTDKELSLREKELELKQRELELKEKEIELQSGSTSRNSKSKAKPSLNDVNNAVSTTNNVKNTFNGLRSLLGR